MEENTNTLNITGSVIEQKVAYKNEKFNETFYELKLDVPRWSENNDILPIIVSEKLLYGTTIEIGTLVSVVGQIRTRNYNDESGRNHLSVFGYAKDISVIDITEYAEIEDKNVVTLEGFICKKPVNRTTSNTGRVITDLLVAVNRKYNRSDYVPVICWGRNAKMAAEFNVGDEIKITGRFQSRTYRKRIGEEEKTFTAYEVSVVSIDVENNKEEAQEEVTQPEE